MPFDCSSSCTLLFLLLLIKNFTITHNGILINSLIEKDVCNTQLLLNKFSLLCAYKLLINESPHTILAHLSQRLIGELEVYEGIHRPFIFRLSTFSNDISSEALSPILFIFHI